MRRAYRAHVLFSSLYFWSLPVLAVLFWAGIGIGTAHRLGEFAESIGSVCLTTVSGLRIEDLWSFGLVLLLVMLLSMIAIAAGSLLIDWRETRGFVKSLPRAALPDSRIERLALQARIRRGVVQVESGSMVALTYGLLSRRILVSRPVLSRLEDAQIQSILLHELCHAKRLDPLKLWIGRALSKSLFLLPVARKLCASYEAASELAADQFVIGRQGHSAHLSSALVALFEDRPGGRAAALPGALTLADLRILQLLEGDGAVVVPALGRRSLLLSAAGLALVAVLVVVLSHGPEEVLSQTSLAALFCPG